LYVELFVTQFAIKDCTRASITV